MFRSAFVPAVDPGSLRGSIADALALLGGGRGLVQVHHVMERHAPPKAMSDRGRAASIKEARRKSALELEQIVLAAFEEAEAAGPEKQLLRYSRSEGEMPRAAARAARPFEVTVLREPSGGGALDPSFLEEFVFHCGRPLVLTPHGTGLPRTPRRIALAWNGKKEAARALALGAPLLNGAGAVAVLSAGEIAEDRPTAEELVRDLGAAGHRAELVSESRERNAARQLSAMATAWEADILLLGAYSTSRLRETVLGGVTKSFLEAPPLPLLLAR